MAMRKSVPGTLNVVAQESVARLRVRRLCYQTVRIAITHGTCRTRPPPATPRLESPFSERITRHPKLWRAHTR